MRFHGQPRTVQALMRRGLVIQVDDLPPGFIRITQAGRAAFHAYRPRHTRPDKGTAPACPDCRSHADLAAYWQKEAASLRAQLDRIRAALG